MKIRWPRLTFPPINLWSAPHQSALEDTMTAVAERDDVQEQLCARIDELERDKEVLNRQLDRREQERVYLLSQADALHRIGSLLDIDPGTDLTREAPARVEALMAFRSSVCGWREADWPEGFCRRTAEMVADRGRQAEGGDHDQ